MIGLAEFTSPDTLRLPAEVAARFRPSDRFVVLAEGDTLYLKRIVPRSVGSIVADAPEGQAMCLDEINEWCMKFDVSDGRDERCGTRPPGSRIPRHRDLTSPSRLLRRYFADKR